MQRVAGWFLALLGVAALVVASAAAIAFGPDDTVALGPHELTTTGTALVTAPRVLPYAGPTLEVTATAVHGRSSVFVGVGHDVDVRDYLSHAAYTQIDEVSLPWRAHTTAVPGRRHAGTSPAELTWWLTSASRRGGATVTFPLPDAPIDVVIMDLDRAPGFTTEVTVRVVQEGVFAGAVGLLLGGVGLLVAARLVLRLRSTPAHRQTRAPSSHGSRPALP